jgi:outer membrane immunogenic protein
MKNTAKAAAVALVTLGGGTVSAEAQDWSGWYGGLAAGFGSGENINSFATSDISGSIAGAFFGYNVQRGNLVFGAEFAASKADISFNSCDSCTYSEFIDLKARVGWASGKALYFGVLGYGIDAYDEAGLTSDGDGLVYGVGVDVMVSEKAFLGAEVLRRDLSHAQQAPFVAFDAEITTVTVRIGMRF